MKNIKIISISAVIIIIAAIIFYALNKSKNNIIKKQQVFAQEVNIQSNNLGDAEMINDNLILLEGGSFMMGSPENERQRDKDEALHNVIINSFYIDPYEVTQKDYQNIMGKNPSHFKGENLPVENITWYDAVEYCNALSISKGLTPAYAIEENIVKWDRSANGYRLLTEAEWEYAARAGTRTVFNSLNHITSDNANFEGSYPYLIEENYVNSHNPNVKTSRYRGRTLEVNSLNPNQFGIYNMHGNVSEWCFDYYGKYDTENNNNPAGAETGSLRISRGGSYIDFAKHLRAAYRSACNPLSTDRNTGFRIARNSKPINDVIETVYSLNIEIPKNPKILIAYFSYSGNTRNAAEIIRKKTGADIIEIKMKNPYRGRGNIYETSQIDLNINVYPELADNIQNIEQYEVILLGYPTWWATMPMPVFSFINEYDFSKKSVITFSSHGGTMLGDSVSDLAKLIPNAYVGLALEFNYSGGRELENRISQWLKLNGIEER
ncbi:flavodoxin [uncultured Brachyspira sp.]|uniref:flavodoxin n=1 Tax=uncultured Brachyspira sp. TaxID=221953 RepID=UPI0025D6378D|nr:flavodoxin [uncultured Brachyspira sp.]